MTNPCPVASYLSKAASKATTPDAMAIYEFCVLIAREHCRGQTIEDLSHVASAIPLVDSLENQVGTLEAENKELREAIREISLTFGEWSGVDWNSRVTDPMMEVICKADRLVER